MVRYPPQTDEIEKLAEFFGQIDTTKLAELEEAPKLPERELASVSLRLPKRDVEVLKHVAAQEGLAGRHPHALGPPPLRAQYLLRRKVATRITHTIMAW